MDATKSKPRAVGILVLLFTILVLAATWNPPEDARFTGLDSDRS